MHITEVFFKLVIFKISSCGCVFGYCGQEHKQAYIWILNPLAEHIHQTCEWQPLGSRANTTQKVGVTAEQRQHNSHPHLDHRQLALRPSFAIPFFAGSSPSKDLVNYPFNILLTLFLFPSVTTLLIAVKCCKLYHGAFLKYKQLFLHPWQQKHGALRNN